VSRPAGKFGRRGVSICGGAAGAAAANGNLLSLSFTSYGGSSRALNRQLRRAMVFLAAVPAVRSDFSVWETGAGRACRLSSGPLRGFSMSVAPVLESRVPLVERAYVPAELEALYDRLEVERGRVPNMFKALANIPPLALGIAGFLKPLMGGGALPAWYKELIATRVASLNRCEYCVSSHRFLAGQRGATPEQIAAYDTYETGPFTEKEKAGFRYATLLHSSGHAIDEAAFAALSAHFAPQETIELTAVAAAFEFFSRFNSALHIPVTPLPEWART
jgi:uncharacterized peroxidase-related enzyme